MAGIYVHIPFCKSRCIYCGFYSTTGLDLRQPYVDAVVKEAGVRSQESGVSTVYFGGGTPSQLSIAQLRQLFDALYIYNKVEADAEVTIECNPDDITPDFAEGLATLPVNRVSMGIQTFDDERLRFIHRRHTAAQAAEAVSLLRQAGIRNISIDLMYGFPGETIHDWLSDIDAAIALHVEHISAYCLMIEEGTPLYQMYHQPSDISLTSNPSPLTTEELEREMYYTLIDRLEGAGYEHYEISNFARPGRRSRHNSSYWTGIPYLGLGAAAHSFDGDTRSWNVSDIRRYIDGIRQGHRLLESEQLDGDTRYNDTVTVALRTREGLDLSKLSDRHRRYCLGEARRYLDYHLLALSPDSTHLHLTRQGLFVSDMIMSDLMLL